MYLWKFTVNGWGDDVGEYTHKGLVCGENFTEAVNNLENYYYNEINTLYIECCGEENEPYLLKTQYSIKSEEVMIDDLDKRTREGSEDCG